MGFKFPSRGASSSSTSTSSPSKFFTITNLILRFLQFVFAVTVLGLYGQDIHRRRNANIKVDSRWAYAEVVGALAALTSLVFMIPQLKSYVAFAWDGVLFILWTAVFGVFGKLFIKEDARGDGHIKRMKNAVWIDLINMLLWFVSFVLGVILFFKYRGRKSLHTGRANV